MRGDEILPSLPRRIYMGVTGAILGSTLGSIIASTIAQHQQSKQNEQLAKKQEKTEIAKAQVNSEQAPELSREAGQQEAVKKRKTSFGLQESVVNNWMTSSGNNTVGQKETWG